MVDGVGRVDSDRMSFNKGFSSLKGKGMILEDKVSEESKSTYTGTNENLRLIEDAINLSMGFIDTRIAFCIHQESGEVIIQIIDNETNEVLKEIPPEELVSRLSKLVELVGLLIDARG